MQIYDCLRPLTSIQLLTPRHNLLLTYLDQFSSRVFITFPNELSSVEELRTSIHLLNQQTPLYTIPLVNYSGTAIIGFYFRSVIQENRFHYVYRFQSLSCNFSNYILADYALDIWKNKEYDSPLILVEGVFDQLALSLIYPYVASNLNATMKFGIATKLSSRVYVCFDDDETGREKSDAIFRRPVLSESRIIPLLGASAPAKDFWALLEQEDPEFIKQRLLSNIV